MTDASSDDLIEQELEREQLHFAAQDGDLGRVRELVAAGFDVNAFDTLGKTPLHYAVEREHFHVVETLLALGANVNAHHEPSIGNTPLREVAGNCSFRMAELLVKAGADPRIEGWMRITALDLAKDRRRDEGRRVYELLLRASMRHA